MEESNSVSYNKAFELYSTVKRKSFFGSSFPRVRNADPFELLDSFRGIGLEFSVKDSKVNFGECLGNKLKEDIMENPLDQYEDLLDLTMGDGDNKYFIGPLDGCGRIVFNKPVKDELLLVLSYGFRGKNGDRVMLKNFNNYSEDAPDEQEYFDCGIRCELTSELKDDLNSLKYFDDLYLKFRQEVLNNYTGSYEIREIKK